MKARHELVLAVLLQGGGGLVTLIAALWIGRALGPEQQGQFNLVKSTVEFGAALAALGMPQALYVHAQARRLDPADATRIGARVALLGLPVGALLALAALEVDNVWATLALAACVALACLQSQWRALTLLGSRSWRFNVVTVAPQLLLLPLAAIVVVQGGVGVGPLAALLAVIWFASSVHAAWELRRVRASGPHDATQGAAPLHALLCHGAATWVTASLATVSVLVLQRSAEFIGGGTCLGLVSLALLLAQVPLTPLGYTIPLLLKWRLAGNRTDLRISSYMSVAVWPMILFAIVVFVIGRWKTDLWMGEGYAGLHAVVACLLLAGGPDAAMRLMAVDAQAERRAVRTAYAECARGIVVVSGALVVAWHGAGSIERPALALAVVWAVAACVAWATLLWRDRIEARIQA